MYSYTHEEALNSLLNAKHLNASAKKIIKSHGSQDPKSARFAKALKAATKSPLPNAFSSFVEKALPEYEEHLLLVARNAYAPFIEPILDEIIEKYADDFNSTYEIDTNTGSITLTAESEFQRIGQAALEILSGRVEKSDLPNNGFIKKAIAYSLFDRSVLAELSKVAKT